MQQRRSVVFWLLAPAMLLIAATSTYPLLFALNSSFRRWQLSKSPSPGEFIGFDNYARAFDDRFFVNSIKVTAIFTIISVGSNHSHWAGNGFDFAKTRPSQYVHQNPAHLSLCRQSGAQRLHLPLHAQPRIRHFGSA